MPDSARYVRSPLAAALWDSPSVAVAVLDETGQICHASPSFDRMVGATARGHRFDLLVCEEHREQVNARLEIATGTREEGTVGMFPDSADCLIDVTLTAVRNRDFKEVIVEPHVARPMELLGDVVRLNEQLGELHRELRSTSAELERHLEEVQKSHLYIRKLEGILPICMICRSVRDDSDQWTELDAYLVKKDAVSLSHSVCPTCEAAMLREQGLD